MKRTKSALLVFGLWLSWGAPLLAEGKEVLARLYSKEGIVEAQSYPDKGWRPIEVGSEFALQDAVRVGKHGRAAIKFVDGTLVRMSNNATIVFDRKVGPAPELTTLRMNSGSLHLFSREAGAHPDVVTPVITAAIHGTEFVIATDANMTSVAVIQGAVEATNQWGSALARNSETIEAVRGRAPIKGMLLDPVGAVQWTLYYPPVLSFDDFVEFAPGADAAQSAGWRALQSGDYEQARRDFAGNGWRDLMGRSLAALLQGDRVRALETVEAFNGPASATFLLYKSSLYLAFGEVPPAEAALNAAAGLTAKAPEALRPRLQAAHDAQAAVIALTRNQSQTAQQLAEQALNADPNSAGGTLALSYIEQTRADLEGARRHVETLSAAHPRSADLLLRRAELELSFSEVEQAEAHVREALAIEPKSALGHAMLGFVELFKNENPESLASFEQAVSLDSGSALARLGLGLARVREKDLAGGRADIEQAVHLAPNVSLYRSYLGKAFFEEDKEDLAGAEYEQALRLDPEDPTPYLYRAFNELAQNKVVDALEDVEGSIARNQNRAIYRSRLLLDRDLGARTANLAQVFNELGFSQAARLEAIKSINADYSNYSAHRLLANSYQTILNGRAHFSEQQISNLLAPLSFNVMESTRADTSINEYTSLFDRIERRTGLNAIYDTHHDFVSGEVYKAGREEKFGWLMDAQGAAQDGSKHNDYYRDYRLRLAGQYQPNYADRLLLDGSLIYQRDRFNSLSDVPTEDRLHAGDLNLGYYHRIDPSSHVVGEVSWFRDFDRYSYLDGGRPAQVLLNSDYAGPIEFEDNLVLNTRVHDDVDQVHASLQHIWDSRWLSTISGYEHVFLNVHRSEDSPILIDDQELFTNLQQDVMSRATYGLNSDIVYGYAIGHLAKWVDLTAGLNFTSMDFEKTDVPTFIDQTDYRYDFNPKVGLTFYPLDNLTVRSAYFRSSAVPANENLRRIEPTLVGGLNQFYADLPGTTGDNYGIGLDYKWPGSDYLGAQYVRRALTTHSSDALLGYDIDFTGRPLIQQSITAVDMPEYRDQDFVNAYYYHVFNKQLVGTLDYYYMREKLDVDFEQRFQRHNTALAFRYFDPSNVFGFIRGNWRHELDNGSLLVEDGTQNLWTMDLGVGYRLPNRHGAITAELLNVTDQSVDLDESFGFEEFIPSGIGGRLVATVNF